MRKVFKNHGDIEAIQLVRELLGNNPVELMQYINAQQSTRQWKFNFTVVLIYTKISILYKKFPMQKSATV